VSVETAEEVGVGPRQRRESRWWSEIEFEVRENWDLKKSRISASEAVVEVGEELSWMSR